jgi:hypothetical protein
LKKGFPDITKEKDLSITIPQIATSTQKTLVLQAECLNSACRKTPEIVIPTGRRDPERVINNVKRFCHGACPEYFERFEMTVTWVFGQTLNIPFPPFAVLPD